MYMFAAYRAPTTMHIAAVSVIPQSLRLKQMAHLLDLSIESATEIPMPRMVLTFVRRYWDSSGLLMPDFPSVRQANGIIATFSLTMTSRFEPSTARTLSGLLVSQTYPSVSTESQIDQDRCR